VRRRLLDDERLDDETAKADADACAAAAAAAAAEAELVDGATLSQRREPAAAILRSALARCICRRRIIESSEQRTNGEENERGEEEESEGGQRAANVQAQAAVRGCAGSRQF